MVFIAVDEWITLRKYYSLQPVYVSRTIVGVLAGKAVRMCLYAVRIKYLHDPTEVDALDEIIYVGMPDVVTEHEQDLLYAPRLGQRNYEMPKIGQSRVNLHDDNRRIRRQRSERFLVVNFLLRVDTIDVLADLDYLEIR